ncbi:MAG: FTR1 family protein [Thermomicrobiales bacterium]
MNHCPRLISVVLLAFVLVASLGRGYPAQAQTLAESPPGITGQAVRSGLFDAQAALLAGDPAAATEGVAAAQTAAAQLLPLFTADPTIAPEITQDLAAAEAAVKANDAEALAIASGEIWATMMRGAYAQTLAAVMAGDADAAASWLLLRDFRLTTRFDRPNADSTVAIRQLKEGTAQPADVAAVVQADLLDTYQARLEALLNEVAAATPGQLTPTQAQAVGLVSGFWPLLAPALAEQQGAEAETAANTAFADWLQAAQSGTAEQFAPLQAQTTQIVQSFRAAPLSEADKARRAGQLLRYLSLIPMEYGRGVKDGQVLLDLEVQEAIAFLDGARASFNDLRLPLSQINPEETAAIDAALANLDAALTGTSKRTAIADPATISAQTADATQRLNAILPKAWLQASGDSDFDIVEQLLDQVVAAAAAGEYQQAESARIEAYAIFETGPEKRLLAFTPDAALKVERLFWEGDGTTPGLYRLIADQAPVNEIRASRAALDTELTNAQAALKAGTAPQAIIFNAATIVFREGLEAILILASLLASMVGANRQFKRPLALGAVAALAVTAILFVLVQNALLSFGQYSEQIEAVVSVIAIGVLLVVMNWFFHKVYWTKWIAKHHEQRRRLLIGGVAGQMLGFAALGFTSVFREGAETVLFLQALVLDAGSAVVVQGVALGLAATAVVGVLTLVLQQKLPHKKMLIVTGVMIAVVLVTMVGQTVHTLQLVGWLPISPIRGAEGWPTWIGVWLGIHGTWQGIIGQLIALVFVFGSYFLAEAQHTRGRKAEAAELAAHRAAAKAARDAAAPAGGVAGAGAEERAALA